MWGAVGFSTYLMVGCTNCKPQRRSTNYQVWRYVGMNDALTFRRHQSLRIAAAIRVLVLGFGTAIFASQSIAASFPRKAAETIEIHQRLQLNEGEQAVALTLDACGGGFDRELIDTLIARRIPATIFATRIWIDRHPDGVALLRAHADLFDIEDHGAAHIPAVVGKGKRVYGLVGVPDVAHLQAEVSGGARAIAATGAPAPTWYRGATAVYDPLAINEIQSLGYRIAGFSVNADAGATLSRREVAARLTRVMPGDIVIAHMNKPAKDTAEGMAEALPTLLDRGIQFVTLRGRNVVTITSPSRRVRNDNHRAVSET